MSKTQASMAHVSSQTRRLVGNAALYAVFAVVMGVFLFPLLAVINLSMKQGNEIFAYPPTFWPASFNLNGYLYVLQQTPIAGMLINSVKLTAFSVAGSLLVSAPAAYAFSRMRFPGQRHLLLLLLVYQMISPLVIAIPLYRYFEQLGLLDTHLGAILVYITVEIPFTVWLLKGFFDSIPVSLDEAARIDGASRLQILRIVILPLAMPGLIAAVIFNVIAGWSQFIIPFILLSSSELLPVSIGVLNFAPGQAEGEVTIPYLAAAAIVAVLPAIVVFVLLQRFIVQALTAGAVKG
jgi:multiple sugar transport system permease protein